MINIIFKSNATASSVPTAGQLELGELAVNTSDGVIFFKDTANSIITNNLTTQSYTDILIPGTISTQAVNIDSNWLKLDGTNIANSNITNIASNMTPALDITEVTLPSSSTWTRGAFVNNKYIAASENTVIVSDDGVTWDSYAAPEVNFFWSAIEYFNGYYHFASTNNKLFYTSDFSTWNTLNTGSYCINLHKFGTTRLTLICRINAYYTTDGTTWTGVSGNPFNSGNFLALTSAHNDNDVIVRIGSNPNSSQILYSTNQGLTWTSLVGNNLIGYVPASTAKCCVWSGDKFVFCSGLSNVISYSYDGINWQTFLHPGITERFSNIWCIGNMLYFFVRDRPYIYVSRAIGPLELVMQPFDYSGFPSFSNYSGSTMFLPLYKENKGIIVTESTTHSYLLNQQDAPVRFLYKGV